MEPVEAKVRLAYIFYTRVAKIEQRKQLIRVDKDGTIHERDLGWFILYEGSHEMLFLGTEKPSFEVGDEIEIIQRRRNAKDT